MPLQKLDQNIRTSKKERTDCSNRVRGRWRRQEKEKIQKMSFNSENRLENRKESGPKKVWQEREVQDMMHDESRQGKRAKLLMSKMLLHNEGGG